MRLGLRWMLVLALGVVLLGGGLILYRTLLHTITLRVAVDKNQPNDMALISALANEMAGETSRFKLRLLPVESQSAAQQMLETRQVDLAITRTDAPITAKSTSLALLYRELAVLGVPADSTIESWGGLSGKTIAVVAGTRTDDPLIDTLLRLHGATQVKRITLDYAKLEEEIKRKRVSAMGFVGALSGSAIEDLRAQKMKKRARSAPGIIEVSDAETLVTQDKRYEEASIPVGALSSAPLSPAESVTTLSVARVLITREDMPKALLVPFTRKLMEVRRLIMSMQPLAVQISAPNLEADAPIRAHAAARIVFGEEEYSLIDTLSNLLYFGPALLGLAGSALVGLMHFLRPSTARPAQGLAVQFLALRREMDAAPPEADDQLAKAHADLLDELIATNADLETDDRAAAFLAADMTDRRWAQRIETHSSGRPG